MKVFAEYMAQELSLQDAKLDDLCTTDRYSMYKIGPVLSISVSILQAVLSYVDLDLECSRIASQFATQKVVNCDSP